MTYSELIMEIETLKEKKPILFELERDKTVDEAIISDFEEYYRISFPDTYKKILKEIGGGYFGFIAMYSLDSEGEFYIKDYVSKQMIRETNMLPIIDLQTGDYIGFEIVDNECVEDIVIWDHDDRNKTKLKGNLYDIMVKLGLYDESLDYIK